MAAHNMGSIYKPFYKDKKFTISASYEPKGTSQRNTRSVADVSSSRNVPKSNSYMKFYQTNCHSIDSRTFSEVKKDVLQILKDPNSSPEVKIMLGDWLFRKIFRCFHMTENVLEEVCNDMIPPIGKCQNTIIKSMYLHFNNLDSVNKIALYYYLNRFSDRDKFFILQLLNDTQLVKNYVQDARITDDSLREHFIKWLKASSAFEQQSNILDVLLKHFKNNPDVVQVYNKMRWGENKERGTLYEDEQNVHDEGIKQSSLDVAEKLIEWDSIAPIKVPPMVKFRDFVTGMLYPLYSSKEKSTIDCVVERMCIDTTYFGDGFTIAELFLSILNYVLRSKHKKELLKRLMEEMNEMQILCASGYIVRLMNVLQGFDDNYTVTVSFSKQLYAVLSKILADSMTDVSEEIIEGSIELNNVYLEHICQAVNKNIYQLIDDYGKDVYIYLIEVLSSITGYKNWKIERGEISY
uniref:Uncharacterized protein n=1 Tax=Marseillevirus LCMAC101 TaxID=2506602 RepID=A0A481YT34_9VIRU|nr:MAG: hypothetical protein LCMAC101_07220 [Marseillevirus LCMAC101]